MTAKSVRTQCASRNEQLPWIYMHRIRRNIPLQTADTHQRSTEAWWKSHINGPVDSHDLFGWFSVMCAMTLIVVNVRSEAQGHKDVCSFSVWLIWLPIRCGMLSDQKLRKWQEAQLVLTLFRKHLWLQNPVAVWPTHFRHFSHGCATWRPSHESSFQDWTKRPKCSCGKMNGRSSETKSPMCLGQFARHLELFHCTSQRVYQMPFKIWNCCNPFCWESMWRLQPALQTGSGNIITMYGRQLLVHCSEPLCIPLWTRWTTNKYTRLSCCFFLAQERILRFLCTSQKLSYLQFPFPSFECARRTSVTFTTQGHF